MLQPIATLRITAPGTLVRCTSTQANPAEKFPCHAVLIQALPFNAGRVFIGWSTMNRVTLANVIAVLAIPTDNTIPSFTAALTLSPNAINLADLYIDAELAAEGAIVSVLIN